MHLCGVCLCVCALQLRVCVCVCCVSVFTAERRYAAAHYCNERSTAGPVLTGKDPGKLHTQACIRAGPGRESASRNRGEDLGRKTKVPGKRQGGGNPRYARVHRCARGTRLVPCEASAWAAAPRAGRSLQQSLDMRLPLSQKQPHGSKLSAAPPWFCPCSVGHKSGTFVKCLQDRL